MVNYFDKYVKYKRKYLALKGGAAQSSHPGPGAVPTDDGQSIVPFFFLFMPFSVLTMLRPTKKGSVVLSRSSCAPRL